MNYEQQLTEDRRLVLLRLLSEQAGYTANGSVLQMALETVGHIVSRDQVRTDIAWLAEQGLLDQRDTGVVWVATLTTRGLDVAQGRTTVPGVRRPSP